MEYFQVRNLQGKTSWCYVSEDFPACFEHLLLQGPPDVQCSVFTPLHQEQG